MAIGTATAIAISAAGTGIKAYSSYQQGRTAKKVSQFNAAEQRMEADRIDRRSREDATKRQKNNERALARIKAGFSKSGLDLTGTPMEVLAEKKFLMESELADTRRDEAAKVKRTHRQAGLTERYGKQAYKAGVIGAGTDLLKGAANIGGMIPV